MKNRAERLFDGGKKSNFTGLIIMAVIAVILILAIKPVTDYVKKSGRVKGTEEKYTPGTYTATTKGFGGEVSLEFTVSKTDIEEIKFTGDSETPDIGGKALTSIRDSVLKSQDINFDIIAGATITSTAAKTLLEKASAEAMGIEYTGDVQSADIVVIGAGGAGMAAAIQATQNGATNVVILEKMPMTGGNSIRATGGLNAAYTEYQKRDGIEDSIELFKEDTMKGGKNLNDPDLVQTLVENSAAAVDWVNEIGGDLSVVGQFGGASVKRIHRPGDTSAVGPMLINAMNKKLEELNVPVFLNTTANHIELDENGNVKRVIAEDKDGNEIKIDTKAVIIATGGFGANSDMVVKYKENLKGFSTTNHPGATGDGIEMALEVGAGLTDIAEIQIHPTVNPETSTMYTEGVRGNGAILVNSAGERFVNELSTRDVVSAEILKQEGSKSWMIFDQSVRDSLSAIEKYINEGIIVEADTIEELADKLGVDKDGLVSTMTKYTEFANSGTDADFGRESMESKLTTAPYYAGLCVPAIHHTMGGIKINTDTQVLKEDGTAINGLYAAGEVVGGVHGANRLGGNAVADIVVFGRIAGEKANDYVQANGGNTERTMDANSGATSDANSGATSNNEAKPEVQGSYTDGTYTGVGKGNGGDVTVEVVVENSNIVSIKLTQHNETPGIYEVAEKDVIANIIKTQSTDVDVVAGATKTSNAIIEGVKNALK